MLDARSVEDLTRSLMLGTARHTLPLERAFDRLVAADDPKARLKALALLAQYRRFSRPPSAPPPPTMLPFADDRRTIAEQMRGLLVSVLTSARDWRVDTIAPAIADAMARRRMRLHPFDLPRLENFVRDHCDQLGVGAIAWAERHGRSRTGDDQQPASPFCEVVDESNWSSRRPAQKEAFIRKLRATDPTRARQLVEEAFPSEKAEIRVRLVYALRARLSPDDIPFLDSLAQDRAPSVREAADRMLAHLPNTPQAKKQIEECLSRIKIGKTGLLRRRPTVRIELPATVDESRALLWARDAFGPIDLDMLAGALALSVDDLIAATADDPVLTQVLAMQAVRSRRYDLLGRMMERAPKGWGALCTTDGPDVADPTEVAAWCTALIRPEQWTDMPNHHLLLVIVQQIRTALPQPLAQRLLASRAWRHFLDGAREGEPPAAAADTINAMVALIPAALRDGLRTDLAHLPPSIATRALGALALLDHIDPASST